ncbi:MAG: glycosyltransferase [Alphaproteobacteria bacterium]|nr:glycosyltransferase [Alphaproteobacteria bacterium]
MTEPNPVTKPADERLRVAVLVDLPRSAQSGGHVKCWERLAHAAVDSDLPINLCVYFSGNAPDEILSPTVRLRHLPPVFSTARLKFLPYVPDHTDLASWHPALARELRAFDVIHTTDGFFAFSQTATKIAQRAGVPMVTSFHTDTPSYTRIFTRQTIEKLTAKMPWLRHLLLDTLDVPERQGRAMEKRLRQHVKTCRYALVTREEDRLLAAEQIGTARVPHLRLGIDKKMFGLHRCDRAGILRDYNIPADRCVFLFVGRVDVGKNIYTLTSALEQIIAAGVPAHLIVAGVGPAREEVQRRLGDHVTSPGFVAPDELARLYASVDALALCSEVEIRSMAGVEAMASGCPVLVSRNSGIAQLFDHTTAMQVVDSGVDCWRDVVRSFIEDKQHQQVMRDAAAEYGRTKLAEWRQVLAEDLFAIWQKSFVEKGA